MLEHFQKHEDTWSRASRRRCATKVDDFTAQVCQPRLLESLMKTQPIDASATLQGVSLSLTHTYCGSVMHAALQMSALRCRFSLLPPPRSPITHSTLTLRETHQRQKRLLLSAPPGGHGGHGSPSRVCQVGTRSLLSWEREVLTSRARPRGQTCS